VSQLSKIGDRKQTPKSTGLSSTNGTIVAFLLFVSLSFLFWYLDALGNDIEADIKYPLIYDNIPENLSTDRMPQRLTLYLEGTGYSMFMLKFSGKNEPIVLDFSKINYRRSKTGMKGQYYLITSGLIENVTEQLEPSCNISGIGPDTIFFYTTEK